MELKDLNWQPYTLVTFYPGMKPLDRDIWQRFITKAPTAFAQVAYDVAIGAGAPFDTTVNKETGGTANRLYQRKVDVLGANGNVLLVIEVKPRASTAAIGQVKGYAALVRRDLAPNGVIHPIILTDALLPEMELLAKAEGVTIIVV